MKRKIIFLTLIIAVIAFTGCQKETIDSSVKSSQNQSNLTSLNQPVFFKPDQEKFDLLKSEYQVRRNQMEIMAVADCMEEVTVPDDYPTIKEAIDAVCEGGTVIVKEGTYNEFLYIFKPGLFIKAIGNVTVNGVIQVLYADNVRIHNFKVYSTTASAIAFVEANGGEAKHNTVNGNGSGYIGILVWRSFNISVKHNNISDQQWGILCGTYPGDGFASGNNTILNNMVTGITFASCIGLQAESDNNQIIGNVVSTNENIYNAAIMLNSSPGGESCDYNIVKNNVTNDNTLKGIWMDDGGHYNTIGPNNTSNSNGEYGILLDALSSNNHVFNNTALENGVCDIVDEGGTDNTYKNNTAECTSGI